MCIRVQLLGLSDVAGIMGKCKAKWGKKSDVNWKYWVIDCEVVASSSAAPQGLGTSGSHLHTVPEGDSQFPLEL